MTWLLERYGSPAAVRRAGRRKLVEAIRPKAPRMAQRFVDDIFTALDEQTVVVPGTNALEVIVLSLAKSLAAVHEQRRALEAQIEALLEAHPLFLHAPRGGNRQLKRAMFLSAFAALHDPASRTYYDRCRARGRTHAQQGGGTSV